MQTNKHFVNQINSYESNQKSISQMDEYIEALDDFKIHAYVMLKMSTIFSIQRKIIKAGESEKVVILFAPILSRIHRVILSRKRITRNRNELIINVD